MKYLVVQQNKLIIGYNPKCAATTLKVAVLLSLGHEIKGNVHLDMLAPEALENGHYGVCSLDSLQKNNPFSLSEMYENFHKICVIRNPYERLLSGIVQRVPSLIKFDYLKNLSVSEYIEYLYHNNYGPDHHFRPQTKDLLDNVIFNEVYDISDMSLLIKEYFPGVPNKKYGGHASRYGDVDKEYFDLKLCEIPSESVFSNNIHNWFDAESFRIIYMLYGQDFLFAKNYGVTYQVFD